MTAAALLACCRSRDISLWAESGRLRFNAPAGALDDALRAELVGHKAEVLALLRAPAPPTWPPRLELADWPPALREKWGRRTAELEAGGRSWREAECMAYAAVRAESWEGLPP